jgi:hypothetical protein
LSAHLTAQQIEDFNGRSASPAELLSTMNHIASCEACREQLSSEGKTRAAVDSLRADLYRQAESNHLSYEELARCVDDCLSQADREVLETHLEVCSPCAAELADLRAFRAEMTTYPETERVRAGSPRVRERIAAFLRAPSYRIPVQLAAAATVLLLCVSIATLVLRKENAVPEISELQHTDEAAQQQNANTAPHQTVSPDVAAPTSEIAEAIQDGGGVVSLDKEGNVTGIESLPAAYQKEIKTALINKRIEPSPQLQGLIGRTGVLMGSGERGFMLIGPVGTIVRTDRPGFRWKSLKGATSYVVAIYDSSFNKVASSEAQSGTQWSPASSLKRGEIYSWQVTAIKDGNELVSPAPPAPDAKFKILDGAKTIELEQARRMHPDSHLVLGILYERAGLLDDAEREFKTLYAANPKSQTTRKLLSDLKSLRRPK